MALTLIPPESRDHHRSMQQGHSSKAHTSLADPFDHWPGNGGMYVIVMRTRCRRLRRGSNQTAQEIPHGAFHHSARRADSHDSASPFEEAVIRAPARTYRELVAGASVWGGFPRFLPRGQSWVLILLYRPSQWSQLIRPLAGRDPDEREGIRKKGAS